MTDKPTLTGTLVEIDPLPGRIVAEVFSRADKDEFMRMLRCDPATAQEIVDMVCEMFNRLETRRLERWPR